MFTAVLVAFLSCGAEPPRFTVENRVAPTFTVQNKTTAPAPANPPAVRYVQVCENGVCRLVPFPAQQASPSVPAAQAVQTYAAPCASGTCEAGGGGWWVGKNFGRAKPVYRK